MSSLGCAVRFILGRLAHWGATWRLSCSSGVAVPSGVPQGSRRVHRGSLGSLECNLGDVGFRWNQWGTHLVSSYSSWLTGVHPGCRRVYPWSLDSMGCSLGSVGFIRGRWVHRGASGGLWVHQGSLDSLGCALGVVGFIRDRWVHWDAPWGPSGSSGVAILLHWNAH